MILSHRFYSGVDTLKYSHGHDAGQSFEDFASRLTRKLDGLNTRAKLEKRINLLTDKFLSESLKNSMNAIVETLELDLKRNLETHCKSYVTMEKEHIESCLADPNYFNLSGEIVKESQNIYWKRVGSIFLMCK